MAKQDDGLMWMVAGGLGSMVLAVVLVPLRTLTPASNLAFVFLAFTIVVAELGGRAAALVTALVSGMSLNFFLTEPYLTLTIEKWDDVIAFFALIGCGLIAAWFGKRRAGLSEVVSRAGTELDVLKRLVDQLTAGAPLDEILGSLRQSFGLSALVLRDADDRSPRRGSGGFVTSVEPGSPADPGDTLPVGRGQAAIRSPGPPPP